MATAYPVGRVNPRLTIAARVRGVRAMAGLRSVGVARLADQEVEAAIELAWAALHRIGVSGMEQQTITLGLRRRAYGEE